ncbi:HPr family phosphocarrier protein [Ruminococcaceae bacterium OttesenSCG-928-D13]|nr:HPr family phosphocarrier protein [Ruminococcaceae bacterium OttesenSCG-928-D13]
MIEFEYTITDKLGIHARPAGLLVREASKYNSDISLKIGEKTADAKKIFSVMGLAAKQGDRTQITVSGEDESTASEALQSFFGVNL